MGNNTLFGVIIGAAIVGTTLLVKEALDDEEKVKAVREKVRGGYKQVCDKVGQGYETVKDKVGKASVDVRETVENTQAVKKLKQTVRDIRRKAEPAETYYAEAEEAEARASDNDAEKVVETEAGIRDAE